jgi:predicted  nucleic acid-binding Zn-ribbon protein
MDKATLEEKKSSIQQQFEALNANNQELNKQITTNNEELLKLAGSFRMLEELLSNLPVTSEVVTKGSKKNG